MKKTHILPLIGLSLCAASFAQTDDQQTPAVPPAEQPAPADAATPAERPAPAETLVPAAAPEEQPTPAEILAPIAAPAEQPAPAEAPAPVATPAEQPAPAEAPAPVAVPAEQPAPAEAPAPVATPAEQPAPAETPAPVAAPAEQPAPAEVPAPVAAPAEQPAPAETPAPVATPAEQPASVETPASVAAPAEQPAPVEAQTPATSPTEQAAPTPAPQTPPPSPEEVREVLSYFLGYRTGQNMTQLGPITMDDIDTSLFVAALADGMMSHSPDAKFRSKDISAILGEYEKVLQARTKEAVAKNTELSNKRAEEYAKEEGVKKLPSGVLAKEFTPGNGAKYDEKKDGANAIMSITYQLRLLDGTVVDESAEPMDISIDGMLPSIADGVKQMPIGAEWELFIPSDKGYGEQAMGPLKCCAPFMFRVKLHEIKKAPAPAEQPAQLTPEMLKQMQEQGLQAS